MAERAPDNRGPSHGRRFVALAARGALLGAGAGIVAGLVDYWQASARVHTFLPSGRYQLALFLSTLYGAAGATALALAGLLAGATLHATDGGALWRAAFNQEESEGRRLAAYGLAAPASLGLVALALHPIALTTLKLYHHRLLIAAVIGAAGALLLVPAAALTLWLAAALSPLVRIGRRARIRFSAPAGLFAAAWILGLFAAAAALGALCYALEARPRMPAEYKALNLALWSPAILGGTLALVHLAARQLPLRERLLATPRGALVAVTLALALPLAAGAAVEWPLLSQLDLRPFSALLVALFALVALLWLDAAAPLCKRAFAVRAAVAVLTPLLLLAVALAYGRHDRVRKAAVAFTGGAGPLVAVIHFATDLDNDGYSSVLGGGDCDDFNRHVHPGAFDRPDDGVDQDCNGHEATRAVPERAPFAALPQQVPRDLNVVLITVDALRADHVGAYGYARPTTPRLDALARESALFVEAFAHAPSTRYSIPAIVTGRYPSSIATALTHWPPEILPENKLISEMLKARGYHTAVTASYGGNGYFEPGWGIFQGFDEYDVHLKSLHSLGGDPANTHGTSSRQLADLDVDWIAKHRREKFFFWTHFYDTHFSFEPHPDMPESNFGNSEIDLYDGEIRFTDFHIGRVLDALKAAGLWDKTLIVVTADHGDGFGEHGIPPNQRHGYHLYATETKVPLIVRVPGLAPRRLVTPVGHVDIVPTLLNAVGAGRDDEPTTLGQSRLGLIAGSSRDDGAGVVFQEVTYEGPSSRYNGTQRRAVVDKDWHYIRNVVPDGTSELYHRSADPAEERDVSGLGGADERRLARELAAWMDLLALSAPR